ncbi:MAG: hypothetical protein IPI20_10945 [Rhodoferax sp.]|jgi:hypothetical protein|nr:hypothetical protein [Rhodoferax sp.]
MPAKKAKFKTYINQQLGVAMGFVAGHTSVTYDLRTATKILCISQYPLTYLTKKSAKASAAK